MKNIRVHMLLSGTGQHQEYRSWVASRATQRGLSGWVRNLPDGKVEVLFEGDERNARMMLEDARRGPAFRGIREFRSELHQYTGDLEGFLAR